MRVSRGEYSQALEPTQAELHRYRPPSLNDIEDRQVINRLEETGKVVLHGILNSHVLGVVVPSSADACTVVVPSGKTDPEAGLLVTLILDEQPSVAVTAG